MYVLLKFKPGEMIFYATLHHPLFLSDLPPAIIAGGGGTFSFFAADATVFFPAAPTPLAEAAGFFPAVGRRLAPVFVTIVVPALVLLASLLLPSGSEGAGTEATAVRFVCLLAVLVPGTFAGAAGLAGLVGRTNCDCFSGG